MGHHLIALLVGACLVTGASALADEVVVFSTNTAALALSPDDVEAATRQSDTEGAGLSFRLAPAASRDFADLTAGAIGQLMTLTVCGEVLVEAVIRERLEGRGYVAFDTLAEAHWYASRMTGETPCDGPRGD
ncbi:SecDF P1 head subdomain-containing protein [Yoonia sp.]|uniref:SecDF P1 head subdomain-containing protein n=1 Tax=Yoonia sp. TaxID=2212373 RepID=UPI002FDA2680